MVQSKKQTDILEAALKIFAEIDVDALLFLDFNVSKYYINEQSNQVFNELLDILRNYLDEGKESGYIINLPSDALIAIVYGAFIRLCKVIQAGELENDVKVDIQGFFSDLLTKC